MQGQMGIVSLVLPSPFFLMVFAEIGLGFYPEVVIAHL